MKTSYRIGCVGLFSDLPIYVAQAKGYFDAVGAAVELTTELGWAGVEAKLLAGTLAAANVPALLPLALAIGLGKAPVATKALGATSIEGDSITVAPSLAVPGKGSGAEPLRIGVESPYSYAAQLFHAWQRKARPDWAPRVTLVPVGVSQAYDLLKDGYLHGFCGAESVGQVAVQNGLGITVAHQGDYFPGSVHTVLTQTAASAAENPEFGAAVVQAIERGRHFCARAENATELRAIFGHYRSSALAAPELLKKAGPLVLRTRFELPSRDPILTVTRAAQQVFPTSFPEATLRGATERVFSQLPLLEELERPRLRETA